MGQVFTQFLGEPAVCPDYTKGPTFDPLYGFPEGRKEREMKVTVDEMESAQLPLNVRDYCAHLSIQHRVCRKKVWPFTYKCAHEKHEYLNCEYEDYVLRMKEFERERRLLERAKRKAAKAAHEEEDE